MMLDNTVWNQFLDEVFIVSSPAAQKQFIVNVSELNVRKGPGTNFTIVRKLKLGNKISIHEYSGKWGKIGNIEWVHTDYLIED